MPVVAADVVDSTCKGEIDLFFHAEQVRVASIVERVDLGIVLPCPFVKADSVFAFAYGVCRHGAGGKAAFG